MRYSTRVSGIILLIREKSLHRDDGSHGRDNIPLNAMATIYNNIPYDTPVIVY